MASQAIMNAGLGRVASDKVSMLGKAIGAKLQKKQQELDERREVEKGPETTIHHMRHPSLRQQINEPLCILNCCGRGKLHLLWVSNSTETAGHTWSSPHSPYTQSLDAAVSDQPQAGGSFPPALPATSREGAGNSLHALDDTSLDASSSADCNGSEPEKLGKIQFSISHDFHAMTLTLKIIRAVDLAAKDFTGTSDPYVKVMLLPDKKNKLTTNIKRRNLNPRWNEVFAFEGFPYAKLMSRILYMQVLDYDRFSRDDPIGEVCIPLCDVDLTTEQVMWKTLQPCKGHAGRLGELQISLCYQPTAECITVIAGKARGLKAKDINGLSDPYVKIWLLRDGKRIEKRKSAVHERSLNPTFNETFMFCVPCEYIRQTSLAVSVMDYDKMGRNERIGQVILGTKSGPIEVRHWNEMFSNSRQHVSRWHILKDFG